MWDGMQHTYRFMRDPMTIKSANAIAINVA